MRLLVSDGNDVRRINICDFSGMGFGIGYFLGNGLNSEKVELFELFECFFGLIDHLLGKFIKYLKVINSIVL